MRPDSVVTAQVYRPRLELALHDPEAFLDLPALLVDTDDGLRLISQARAYGVEPVIHRFPADRFLVEPAERFVRDLSVRCTVCPGDKALIVVLIRMS